MPLHRVLAAFNLTVARGSSVLCLFGSGSGGGGDGGSSSSGGVFLACFGGSGGRCSGRPTLTIGASLGAVGSSSVVVGRRLGDVIGSISLALY